MSEGVHGPVNGDEKAPRRGKLSARGDAAQWNVGDSARFHQTMPSRPYAGNSQICGGGNKPRAGPLFQAKRPAAGLGRYPFDQSSRMRPQRAFSDSSLTQS